MLEYLCVYLSDCPPAGLCSKDHFQRRFVQSELPTDTPPPCFPLPKPTQTDPQTYTQGSAREEGAAEMKGWAGCKAGLALCRALPAGPETLQPNPPLCSGSLETTPLGLSGGNTPRSSPCSPPPQESAAPLGLALEGCAYLPSVPASKLWTLPTTSAVPHTHFGNPRSQWGLGKGRHGAGHGFSWVSMKEATCISLVKHLCFSNLISQGDNSPPQGTN